MNQQTLDRYRSEGSIKVILLYSQRFLYRWDEVHVYRSARSSSLRSPDHARRSTAFAKGPA